MCTVTPLWDINIALPKILSKLKELRLRSRLDAWSFRHNNAPGEITHDPITLTWSPEVLKCFQL